MVYDSQVYGLRGVSGILTSAKYMVYGRQVTHNLTTFAVADSELWVIRADTNTLVSITA